MARICPETGDVVLYLTCLECDDKVCEKVNGTPGNKEKDKYENIIKYGEHDSVKKEDK